jgi:biopolymer transport protein ExbB
MGLKIKIEKTSRTPNLDRFMEDLDVALANGGTEAAKELCRNTRGKYAAAAYLTIEMLQEHQRIKTG